VGYQETQVRKGIAGWVFVALICSALWTTAVADSRVVQFEGHSYQRIDTSYGWHAAKANCAAMNAHLVTLTSAAESLFVWNAFNDQAPWWWIGATDEGSEGTWRWITSEPWVFDDWAPNEPNDMGAGEDYGILWDVGVWNDVASTAGGACMSGACEQGVYYMPSVCEWDAPATHDYYLRPVVLEYGGVLVGSSLKRGFTLTNSGTAPLTITTIELLGPDRAQYALKSYCGAVVEVDSRCWIAVTFAPTSIGYKKANLHVVAGGIDRHRALRGTAVN
jgi:hypothetical protein